jgi:tetratricopeptide (TPR) repeat protein
MRRNENFVPGTITGQGPDPTPDLLLDDLWERGTPIDVRTFLAPWRDQNLALRELVAVLRVDQRRRWLSGQRVDVTGYRRDFPELEGDSESFFELVYNELLIREELGERPNPDDYAALYPELTHRLRLQLEVHRALSSDDLGGAECLSASGALLPGVLRVPGYELLGEIGRGGMGIVYRARQLKPNRLVALKMILDGRFASRKELLRFENEGEIIAGLDHPNIVPILEAGQHQGLHYFSMPLFTGGSLAVSRSRPAADLRVVVRLVADVASAVHHAHERGILHRDLKPANILLDDEGRPHVTDFGLAKRVRDGRDLTETGAILGSPGYMSPEQASGKPVSVTTASDVYGLGAILYALLTGRAPFEGSSVQETITRLNEQPPEPPSRLNRLVPRSLDQICLMCLEKDPDRRYATAKALAADLHRWLAGEPVLARPEPLAERTRRWIRRRRTAVTAAAAATLVAVVGLVVVLAVQVRANRDLKAANDREQARFDLAMDAIKSYHTGVSEDLLLKEPQFQGLRTKLLRGAREFFGKLETLLEGHTDRRSQQAMSQAYDDLAALTDKIGSKSEALELCRRALALRRALAHGAPADAAAQAEVGRCLLALGALQGTTGHADEAIATYREAQALLASVDRRAEPRIDCRADVATCDHRIGDLLAATSRFVEALSSYEKGRSLRLALYLDHPDIAAFRSGLAESDVAIGVLLWKRGQPADAVASFEKARAMLEALARDHPTTVEHRHQLARCYNAIGFPLHAIGKTNAALNSFESARAILETLVRENPAVTEFRQQLASSLTQIGTLMWDTGRRAEALGPYQEARALLEAIDQANPAVPEIGNDLARCYSQLGYVLSALGKPGEALASSEKARTLREALVEANPNFTVYKSDLSVTLGLIGFLKREAGQVSEATTHFRKAIALLDGLPSRTPEESYNLACRHAALAEVADLPGSGVTGAEGRAAADHAMAELRRAASTGFRVLSLMAFDHDLDPLRSRPDFQMLLSDLSFPGNPFIR